MRGLTAQEQFIIDTLGRAVSEAAKLSVLHTADMPEMVHHIHACQNIILARPAFEASEAHAVGQGAP